MRGAEMGTSVPRSHSSLNVSDDIPKTDLEVCIYYMIMI